MRLCPTFYNPWVGSEAARRCAFGIQRSEDLSYRPQTRLYSRIEGVPRVFLRASPLVDHAAPTHALDSGASWRVRVHGAAATHLSSRVAATSLSAWRPHFSTAPPVGGYAARAAPAGHIHTSARRAAPSGERPPRRSSARRTGAAGIHCRAARHGEVGGWESQQHVDPISTSEAR